MYTGHDIGDDNKNHGLYYASGRGKKLCETGNGFLRNRLLVKLKSFHRLALFSFLSFLSLPIFTIILDTR